jgi:predicted O-methyltransferase YrrM
LKIQLVGDDRFFSEFYGPVSDALHGFPAIMRRLKLDPTNEAFEAPLIDLGHQVVSFAFAICALPDPFPAADGRPPIVVRLKALQSAIAASDRDPQSEHFHTCAEALARHIAHYEGGAAHFEPILGSPPADEDSAQMAGAKQARADYLRDMIVNCIIVLSNYVFNAYQWTGDDPRKASRFFDADSAVKSMSESSAKAIAASRDQLEGWCSPQKAALLYALAREHKPTTVVEIGIYGGRSIVPMALALRDNGAGSVYGIESWSPSASVKYRTNIGNDFWWMSLDYEKLKKAFFGFLGDHELFGVVRVIETTSDRAQHIFDEIDMLHIDGGHSIFGSAQDVVNYVAKVRRGGIVVFDDINWSSTAPALQIVIDSCRLLHVVEVDGNPGIPGCAAFMKI